MYIDPTIVSWLLIGGASLCSFMVGKLLSERNTDKIINDTIMYLIDNNYVRAKQVSDGEWEIIDLDGNEESK